MSNTEIIQLEGVSSKNERRSKYCGWLVVGGLVLEVVLAIEFPAHSPPALAGSWLDWIETWSPVFADVLVASGVWGEIWFAGKVRKAEEKLRRRSNKRVEDAEIALAAAIKIAGEAHERAANAELETQRLKERMASRALTPEQQRAIAEELSAFKGQRVYLVASPSTSGNRNLFEAACVRIRVGGLGNCRN